MGSFPAVPGLQTIIERLPLIFPEGIAHRGYVIREMAAKTIWVMFYAGAIHGCDCWIRPSHVYLMTDAQAAKLSETDRESWYVQTLKPGFRPEGRQWYADTTREPIRDETLRLGLIPTGAVIERPGLATTSSLPKYALEPGFAALFDETLGPDDVERRIEDWKARHLSKAALARLALVRKGAAKSTGSVLVHFPSGETRNLQPGPSSLISKAVIEEFANRFLEKPAVLWLSESGNKVVARDDDLAATLGLEIDPAKNLPDIILVDLSRRTPDILVVFVEVVATDGPINQPRKEALRQLALSAGFSEKHLAFLTAFADRAAPAYKKCVPELAWGSFPWFMSEPENIVCFQEGSEKVLSELR